MITSLKKLALFFVDLIRPLFLFWAKKSPHYFEKLRANFSDPYLSGMISGFSLPHDIIYQPNFEKTHVDASEIEHLRELSKTGTLVYVMKNRGQLEYSYFNHLFLKERIPLARFANGCRTLYWRPFGQIFKVLIAKLDYYYQHGLLEDPIRSDYLENLVAKGESALLNLKVSRELIFRADEKPIEFIPPLLNAAKKSEKPIYLITQQFLYDRHPENSDKSLVDLLFGEKSNPGMFRKLILFLLSYRKKATIKFGEALDLKKFMAENPSSDSIDLAGKLNNVLLSKLMIDRKSITGPALISRDKLLDKMLRSKSFKEDLLKIEKETGKSVHDLQKKATQYFEEIAATINYNYVDLYDRMIHWMVNNIYDGLDMNIEGLAKVKAVAGKYPIVLVPSHKSHIDYLLLSYVFINHDLTLPHICAGINLDFWPAGRFLRRGGAFFIRRSLEGNPLYKVVLEHYLKTLIHEGYTTEFFIEGTRSRTGKLLKPKMGILSMLMDAYLDGASPNLYFVPIAINYERILEEKSYEDETRGASKKTENVKALFGIPKKFGKKYGKVFIRFAEPISLKDFMDAEGIEPKTKRIEDCRHIVPKFAFKLTYNINRVSVVTSTSLVATSLLSCSRKGIPEKEVLERVAILRKYLDYKQAGLSQVVEQRGDWASSEALQKLTTSKLILAHQDFWEKFYTIEEPRRMVLDYHKNNSIHFFVSLVCFSKILAMAPETELSMDEIKKRYEAIKTLIRHDFTFSERGTLEDHIIKVIDFYIGEKLLHYDRTAKVVNFLGIHQNTGFRIYGSLLDNFFESAYLTLLYIKHVPFEKQDRKILEAAILEKGRLLYLKGELRFPEALSQFNIRNALSVFEDLGFVERIDKLLSRRFDAEAFDQWEKTLLSLLGYASQLAMPLLAAHAGPTNHVVSSNSEELH